MRGIHSILFVPAEDRRLEKIGATEADAYIIDLEDSIDGDGKDAALERTAAFLQTHGADGIFVRINKDRREREINALGKFGTGFVLPKFDGADDYADAACAFDGRPVVALIESPKALMNAAEISALPWVTALALGAEDLTAAAGMKNTYENLALPKTLLALSAKANGKPVYDTPCFRLGDSRILEAECAQAADLGFDGKLAIHPKQLPAINAAFRVKDRERLTRIVEIYRSSGKAVCEIDGVVYEKLHIDRIISELDKEGKR